MCVLSLCDLGHYLVLMTLPILTTGIVLLRALQEAREMAAKQRKIYEDYSANFTPAVLSQWQAMVDAWDADPTQPDPYEEPSTGARSCVIAWSWSLY